MRGAKDGIYMDYQATTPADPRVVEAMQPYWSALYGNPHSADHAFGWSADAAVETARGHIAALIGADPDEIVFTSGATEANNLAVLGIARASPIARKRIVVSAIEHKCVLAAARAAADEGFEVITVPVEADGIVDPRAIAGAIDDRVALVSVMAVNNEIGTVQPLSEIAHLPVVQPVLLTMVALATTRPPSVACASAQGICCDADPPLGTAAWATLRSWQADLQLTSSLIGQEVRMTRTFMLPAGSTHVRIRLEEIRSDPRHQVSTSAVAFHLRMWTDCRSVGHPAQAACRDHRTQEFHHVPSSARQAEVRGNEEAESPVMRADMVPDPAGELRSMPVVVERSYEVNAALMSSRTSSPPPLPPHWSNTSSCAFVLPTAWPQSGLTYLQVRLPIYGAFMFRLIAQEGQLERDAGEANGETNIRMEEVLS